MSKAKITIEFDIKDNTNVKVDDILKSVVIDDDYVVDGFCITTDIENHNNTEDFFLSNGKIIRREIIENGK